MVPLHPTEAIGPAFTRTQQTLLTPFRFGRALKLALCSYLALAGGLFLPYPLFFLLIPKGVLPSGVSAWWFGLLALVPFAAQMALFYVGNRMSLVEFEMIATRSKIIAPMWNRYGARTWPLMGWKMAWGTMVSLLFAPVLAGRFRGFFSVISHLPAKGTAGTPADSAAVSQLFGEMVGIYALVILLMFSLKIFDTLLNDFVLPFYAMEDVSLRAAAMQGWNVVRREPGQVVLYLVMKFVLTLVGYVAMQLASMVCIIPLLILFFLITAVGALLMHALAGPVGHVVVLALGIVFYGALYLAFVTVLLAVAGFLMNFLDAYAIYFLGGRYPRLGAYLAPADYTFAPPPLPPSDDEDDGAPLPLDPAIA